MQALNLIFPPLPMMRVVYRRSGKGWWAIPPKARRAWFHPLAWERLNKARANLHLFHFGFDGRYDFPKARAMAKGEVESPAPLRKLIAALAGEAPKDKGEALKRSLEDRLFYLQQLLCFALALQPPDQRGHLLGGFEGGLRAWAARRSPMPGSKPLPPPTPLPPPLGEKGQGGRRAPPLGEKAKKAILSRIEGGLSPSEVAQELSIPLSTVYRFLASHKKKSQ
jgi:hypothetical protein